MFNGNNTVKSVAETIGITDESVLSFMADMQKSGTVYQTSEEALAAYEAHLKTVGKTVDWAAAKNKLLSASMKVLSTVGWMAVMTLATELLSAGIRKIDDYIHRVENAREKLEETTSDLESVESELKSIGEQIDDILSKGELSITDENDLKRLQLENEELERRKKLLELQKQEESKELNEAAEDKYRKQFQTKRVSVWIPEDERVNNVNPNQTRATKSVTQEEKFAYNLKLAKELASYEGKITEEQAKQYEELQTYFLEQADSLSDIKDGYNAITPEQQEQLKIWNQMIDDAIWVSENFPGSAKNVTSRLMDKFAGGFNKNDGSTYLSTSDIDKQIGSWIDSLSEDEKLILLQCDIEDATLDDLKSYLKEQTKEIAQDVTISISDIFSLEDAEGKATPLSDLNDQLSDVTSAYETCLAARDEYNKQGYLSVDTLQSVLALGDEYLQYLFDEEGNVSLDAEAFQKLTLARINDMETQALANLAQNIQQISDEATATEYLAQKQNELALSYTDTAASALFAMTTIEGFSDSEALQNAYNSFVTQYEQIKNLFAKTRAGIITEYNGKSKTDTDYKSILDKEITAQEKAYEAGKTTFKKYLDNRKQLVEKYYHDKKITTAEYYEELEDLAQAEADFYDEVLAAVTRRIQREIDGIQDIIDGIQKQIDQLEKQKDTYDSVISAVTRRYDKEIESINDVIEALEKQNEELEEQKDTYDSVISAVTSRYDKEIDGIDDAIDALEKQNEKLEDQQSDYDGAIDAIVAFLGEQKDAIQDNIDSINDENDSIQDQIDKYDQLLNAVTLVFDEKRDALQAEQDAIQDRIDALQAENDEYEKAIELEKAKDALLKAQTQRNKYLYSGEGRGFIYQTDTDAIADAEQTLSELTFQSTVDALEKEKELLQDVIDKLDETEQAWQDIADAFDNQKAKSTAQELFGDDYESIILNGDPDMIASIMNQYTSAQQKLEDNDNTISSLEEQMAQFDEMIEKWESVASAKEEATNQENAALLLGEQWQELILANKESDFEDFKNKYLAIQNQILDNQAEINSLNEKKQIYQDLKDQWSSITEEYQKNLDAQNALLMLGATWEADILSGRIETYEGFRDNYLSIQAQIDDNQSLIDSYNEKIEYYENLKAEWEELSSLYQEKLEDKMAQDALGADWETQIQAGRLEAFDSFKNDYLSIQAQINDNQALIDSYNEKIEYYEDLKAQWEDISDVYQREVDDQLITQALGANGEADILAGRLETLNAFKEQYLAAQQALADAAWASANEQIKAAKEAEKGANGTTGDSPDITNETTATPQYLSPSKTNVERIAEDLAQFADDFESGSTKSGGGAPALDKRLRLQAYAKGGIINDENSSGALDWLAKLLGEDHTVVVGNGERVLSSKDNQAYEKLLDLSSRIQPNIPDVNVNPFDYTKIRSENREMNVTQNINITLPNVTNTSGYDKLVKELQGLQIMAYQNSFKK